MPGLRPSGRRTNYGLAAPDWCRAAHPRRAGPALCYTFTTSHQVQLVIPANAGIQWNAALGTGFRRCDGGMWALCTQIKGRLNIMAFKYTSNCGRCA